MQRIGGLARLGRLLFQCAQSLLKRRQILEPQSPAVDLLLLRFAQRVDFINSCMALAIVAALRIAFILKLRHHFIAMEFRQRLAAKGTGGAIGRLQTLKPFIQRQPFGRKRFQPRLQTRTLLSHLLNRLVRGFALFVQRLQIGRIRPNRFQIGIGRRRHQPFQPANPFPRHIAFSFQRRLLLRQLPFQLTVPIIKLFHLRQLFGNRRLVFPRGQKLLIAGFNLLALVNDDLKASNPLILPGNFCLRRFHIAAAALYQTLLLEQTLLFAAQGGFRVGDLTELPVSHIELRLRVVISLLDIRQFVLKLWLAGDFSINFADVVLDNINLSGNVIQNRLDSVFVH